MKMRTRMYALLFFTFTILAAFAADDQNCDCPATAADRKFQKSCGPLPANMENIYGDAENCKAASGKSLGGIMNTVKSMQTKADIKSPKEVLDYMNCYASRNYDPDPFGVTAKKEKITNSFCEFKRAAPMIELAAKSAGLPFAVQACLYFRESQFYNESLSPAGAIGYVQFLPGAVKTMDEIISQTETEISDKIKENNTESAQAKKSLAEAQSSLAEVQNEIAAIKKKPAKQQDSAKLKKLKEQSGSLVKKVDRFKKDSIYLDTLATTFKAQLASRKVWDHYWKDTENPPKQIKNRSVECPQTAFVLSVMKQTYDANLLDGNFDNKFDYSHPENGRLSINGMSELNSSLLLAGAYNGGVSGLASKCGGIKVTKSLKEKDAFEKCLKKFPSTFEKVKDKKTKKVTTIEHKHESANYMTSIQACAKKGSSDPMTKFNAKNCEEFKCKK